jgi:hypothetical protein
VSSTSKSPPRDAFGSAPVTRHNKVFTVRETTRNLTADVVPCFTYRWHYRASPVSYHEGIRLISDNPSLPINNYPQQHYDNGVAKNDDTNRRFKRVVRILKRLENQMVEDGVIDALASYLIESMVFNAPNTSFGNVTWAADVRGVLGYIWENTKEAECEKRWLEVNGIKYLFHPTQKWTREEARGFVWEAWQYVEKS